MSNGNGQANAWRWLVGLALPFLLFVVTAAYGAGALAPRIDTNAEAIKANKVELGEKVDRDRFEDVCKRLNAIESDTKQILSRLPRQ